MIFDFRSSKGAAKGKITFLLLTSIGMTVKKSHFFEVCYQKTISKSSPSNNLFEDNNEGH